MNAIETIKANQKQIRIDVIKNELQRLITVKGNLRKSNIGGKMHPTKYAIMFINSRNNPTYCSATEENVFSAMQEGRSF